MHLTTIDLIQESSMCLTASYNVSLTTKLYGMAIVLLKLITDNLTYCSSRKDFESAWPAMCLDCKCFNLKILFYFVCSNDLVMAYIQNLVSIVNLSTAVDYT